MSGSDNAGNPLSRLVKRHVDLDVHCRAFEAAMRIFELTHNFPKEETDSLTAPLRLTARSVCTKVADAWRQRRSEAALIAGLAHAESAAAETQTWIQFAVRCEYLPREAGEDLYHEYDEILALLLDMIANSSDWVLRK